MTEILSLVLVVLPLFSVVVPEWPEEDSHRRELVPHLERKIQIEQEILNENINSH